MHLKVCAREGCFNVFEDNHGRKYCSPNCRSKGWYKKVTKPLIDKRSMKRKNCMNCGKLFYTVSELRKYCNGNCKQQHYRERIRFERQRSQK